MLKAVRFDPETHEHLLTYVENYRDKKGKPNHSEAIRILMEKGFEALNSSPIETTIKVEPIDTDSIKEQVYRDIMEALNKKFFSQMGAPAHAFTQVNSNAPAPKPEPVPPPKPKPSPPRVDVSSIPVGNGLLANILGNANR